MRCRAQHMSDVGGKLLQPWLALGPSSASLSRMAKLKLTIVLNSGARVGPGKIALLESIQQTGSISAAARSMGMDYKRAWLLLDSLNQAFEEPVLAAATGGTKGGGAQLTAFGIELLRRYRRVEAMAARDAESDLAFLALRARPEIGSKI